MLEPPTTPGIVLENQIVLEFPDVPLAELPEEFIEIELPDVPLAEMPQTGIEDTTFASSIGLVTSLMALSATLGILINRNKKTDDDEVEISNSGE